MGHVACFAPMHRDRVIQGGARDDFEEQRSAGWSAGAMLSVASFLGPVTGDRLNVPLRRLLPHSPKTSRQFFNAAARTVIGRRRCADVAQHLRRGPALGAGDQTAHAIGPHAGVMPPWYMEKNSASRNTRTIRPSASGGRDHRQMGRSRRAARQPCRMPPAKQYDDSVWHIGTPDLIVKTKNIVVKAGAPDWWGEIEPVPIPLTKTAMSWPSRSRK